MAVAVGSAVGWAAGSGLAGGGWGVALAAGVGLLAAVAGAGGVAAAVAALRPGDAQPETSSSTPTRSTARKSRLRALKRVSWFMIFPLFAGQETA